MNKQSQTKKIVFQSTFSVEEFEKEVAERLSNMNKVCNSECPICKCDTKDIKRAFAHLNAGWRARLTVVLKILSYLNKKEYVSLSQDILPYIEFHWDIITINSGKFQDLRKDTIVNDIYQNEWKNTIKSVLASNTSKNFRRMCTDMYTCTSLNLRDTNTIRTVFPEHLVKLLLKKPMSSIKEPPKITGKLVTINRTGTITPKRKHSELEPHNAYYYPVTYQTPIDFTLASDFKRYLVANKILKI